MAPIKTVLCPTDFSAVSIQGVELAADLAGLLGAQLVVAHAVEPTLSVYMTGFEVVPESVLLLAQDRARAAEERLRQLATRAGERVATLTRVTTNVQPQDAILALARELPADLIVMGTHGRTGLGHLFLGSVTERVVAHAPCPVVALRDMDQYERFRPLAASRTAELAVLVPIDFSSHSLAIVEQAMGLAATLPLRVILLHVVDPVSWGDLQEFRITTARERLAGFVPASLESRIETLVSVGTPAREICRVAQAKGARLVVMGAERHGVLDHLIFGASTKDVLRHAPCPVWVVPAPGPIGDAAVESSEHAVAG
jgi:nucleotide-binding universal stress UspA family protein